MPLLENPVVMHLRSILPGEFAPQLTTQTAIGFRKGMPRQLKRYLNGGQLCELPAELVLASNAPADNMIYFHLANASDAYLSAKV